MDISKIDFKEFFKDKKNVNIDSLLILIMSYCHVNKTDKMHVDEIVRAISEANKMKMPDFTIPKQ